MVDATPATLHRADLVARPGAEVQVPQGAQKRRARFKAARALPVLALARGTAAVVVAQGVMVVPAALGAMAELGCPRLSQARRSGALAVVVAERQTIPRATTLAARVVRVVAEAVAKGTQMSMRPMVLPTPGAAAAGVGVGPPAAALAGLAL